MICLEVISVAGQSPASPLEASFDSSGGTIGRAPTNGLVLADPARTVSRVHAQFIQRDGMVKVIARGTNPLLVDGQLVEMGDEVPVANGARLELGAYVLKAALSGSPMRKLP
jgi:predicted component of type VI protein secretion system